MRFLLFLFNFCFANNWWRIDDELASTGNVYQPSLNKYQFQVSFGADFPYEVQPANNNVGIIIHDERIYIGFRKCLIRYQDKINGFD